MDHGGLIAYGASISDLLGRAAMSVAPAQNLLSRLIDWPLDFVPAGISIARSSTRDGARSTFGPQSDPAADNDMALADSGQILMLFECKPLYTE